MKLHNNGNEEYILSSDDIIVTGKNAGKDLTNLLNDYSGDINDLKKYTKWLYKYGGTGSKYGGGTEPVNPSYTLSYQMILANLNIKNGDYINLDNNIENDARVPFKIIISNVNVNNTYKIKNLIADGTSVSLNNKNQYFTIDNDYTQTYSLNLSRNNKGRISFTIQYTTTSGGILQQEISFNYIKNAYAFTIDIVNNNENSLFNNDTIFYANSVNTTTGVNLKINYDLYFDNDIIVSTENSNIISETNFILNPVDKKEGKCIIPFNESFITDTENLIGDYSIALTFTSNGINIDKKIVNFSIVPNNDVYIKLTPVLQAAQIYKYNISNTQTIYNDLDVYSKYYELYNKLNINKSLDTDEVDDIINYFNIDRSSLSEQNFYNDLLSILYNKLNNYNFYVFSTGNIGFYASPYMPIERNDDNLYYKICKIDEDYTQIDNISNLPFNDPVNLGYIKSTQKNKLVNINIAEAGVYVLSVYGEHTNNKLYYYMYVYNKDNTYNWYRNDINDIFNKNKTYLHYYRNGNVTEQFIKYKQSQYIKQFSSGSDINICNIDFNAGSQIYDCFISIGIQYSYINENNTNIITINSMDQSNNLKIDVYQNKITIGQNSETPITLFLPKETNYNSSDNSKYHLLSIYKRFLYRYNQNPYYEICVYLDGILEGIYPSLADIAAPWNSIILHPANYSINLCEISYIPHDDKTKDENGNDIIFYYLDDIAISEYHYKYANENGTNSNANDKVNKIIDALRQFKETDYGMIKVENSSVIKEISKTIDIPIIVFTYNEGEGKRLFVKDFLQTREQEESDESPKPEWELTNVYYSPGLYELDLTNNDAIVNKDINATWYIKCQGSSTMQYFVKNLTFGLKSNESGSVYLFTPNFKYAEDNSTNVNEATKSFLPEKSFTLKADLVDSSHCNNTSIGDFVNANTKKFDIKFDDGRSSVYRKYIKNCLTGFPILTFIKVDSYDAETSEQIENIYFLGIYNFNLGRDSYFNLGYYDPKLLEENHDGDIHNILKTCDGNKFVTMKFVLTNAADKDLRMRESVIIAEIQGNSWYNDFSQYDKSILAPNIANPKDIAMFGDFVPELDNNNQDKILWHLQRLVEHVAKGGGYIFEYILKKHLGLHEYAYSKYIDDGVNSSIFNCANQVPTYRLQFKRDPWVTPETEYLRYLLNIPVNSDYENIIDNLITNNSDEYKENLKNCLNETIFNEILDDGTEKEAILDYVSLAEYYTICMAFGMTDSVMKNLNVKTWNASWLENYMVNPPTTGITGKWYVAFYDMDTAFGRYNDGTYLNNSYFAFSDYWSAKPDELSIATIYRDFKPKENKNDPNVRTQVLNIEGFDVPSSYLFAIAKYAAIAFNSNPTLAPNGDALNNGNDNFKMYVPNNIWTKFRAIPNDITQESPYYNLQGIGELRNAKYFVNKYFSNNMNNIPEQLWNMNYRFKYLKRIESDSTSVYGWKQSNNQNGFSTKEYKTFHGRGIYQLEDWLNYRLHILDTYFNIDGITTPIKYLEYVNGYNIVEMKNSNGETMGYTWEDTSEVQKISGSPIWKNIDYYDISPVSSYDLLRKNEDCVLLRDIFSQNNEGNRYSGVDITFKAMEYSPMLYKPWNPNEACKYLLINPDTWYNITKTQQSTDRMLFGGSCLWTDIQDASSLIVGNALNIFSDKIQNVIVTKGICEQWNIGQMRSLRKIDIRKQKNDTISNFSGRISIDSSAGEDVYPDLTTIILDRTSIDLSVIGTGLKTVEYTNSTGSVSLIDCNNLSSVNLSNSNINTCSIYPAWSNNINISNSSIKKLKIQAKNLDSDIRTIRISNNIYLEELEIIDFTHIQIENCNVLNNLTISGSNGFDGASQVKSLIITNCNLVSEDDKYKPFILKVNGIIQNVEDNEYELPLNAFINLEEISLEGTKGIKKIDLTECSGVSYTDIHGNNYNGINLLTGAIQNTIIETISTLDDQVLFIKGPYTFSNCGYSYGNNILYIPKTTTSLAGMFNYSYIQMNGPLVPKGNTITNIDAGVILGNATSPDKKQTIYEDQSLITDISNMFYGQTNIKVTRTTDIYQSSLDIDELKYLSLQKFTGIKNISNIFALCPINRIDASLFGNDSEYMGMNSETININSFITSSNVNFEIHSLKYIINKIPSLIASDNMKLSLNLFNKNDLSINQFKLQDLFKTYDSNSVNVDKLELKKLDKLNEFIGFELANNCFINWEDAFVYRNNEIKEFLFPNLTKVSFSFNRITDESNISTLNMLNENLEDWGLDLCNHQILIKNAFNFTLGTPINYQKVINTSYYNGLIPVTTSEFSMRKYIKEVDFINILKSISTAQNRITNLDYKFQYITILKQKASDETPIDYEFKTHDNEVNTPYSFTSCKYTFDHMLFKYYDIDSNIHNILHNDNYDISIELTQNSLKYFTNCKYWNYAFSNITLHKNLPLNLFNKYNGNGDYVHNNYTGTIESLEGTFSNIKIDSSETYFKHEDYPEICKDNSNLLDVEKYNNNDELDGSYHSTIYVTGLTRSNVKINNPKSKGNENEIINHLILPFDIFYGCTQYANIKKCFMNSEFEGILPTLILRKSPSIAIDETFKNLLVIPNRIYNAHGKDFIYNETQLLYGMNSNMQIYKSIYTYLQVDNMTSLTNDWYQRHKTYVFVPRQFTESEKLTNAFNFKVILPLSVANKPSNDIDNPHNTLYEHYFIFTNTSIPDGRIEQLLNCMPGVFQSVLGSGTNPTEYELYNINPDINNGIDNLPRTLDPRAFHNIHYSLMLKEPNSDNQEFDGEDLETLTGQIISKIIAESGADITDPNLETLIREVKLNYGISYKNYGMTITELMLQDRLSGFMNSLPIYFMYGNIINYDTELSISSTDNGLRYESIFSNIEGISKYCILPSLRQLYSLIMSVNSSNGAIRISAFNCGSQNSLNNYIYDYSGMGINMFSVENDV